MLHICVYVIFYSSVVYLFAIWERFLLFLLLCLFLRWSLALSPGWKCSGAIIRSLQPCPSLHGEASYSPASASRVSGTTGTHHHTQLIIVFLVETRFHRVGQDGLNLLPPWSACLGLPKCWDYRCKPLHPDLTFVFLVKTGFHHVAQVGQEIETILVNMVKPRLYLKYKKLAGHGGAYL